MQPENLTGNQRGRIGERLVECYINDELIPSLKKTEGGTDIIYTVAWHRNTSEFARSSICPESFEKFWEEREARLLLANGYYPKKEFHDYFKKLISLLSNTPDGFLIKMNQKGTKKSVKEAVEEFDITSTATFEDSEGNLLLDLPKESISLPLVDGKIDVIEVKTGKGNQLQTDSYRNAVANGYALHLFKVDLNRLEIKDKLIVNPNLVVSKCLKKMDTFAKRCNL